MRIAILTGGGDVPGLNTCIKAIATSAHELGWEAVGFRRGWAGPIQVDPQNEETEVSWIGLQQISYLTNSGQITDWLNPNGTSTFGMIVIWHGKLITSVSAMHACTPTERIQISLYGKPNF